MWLAHMRQGLSRFYQRGFGMARDFGFGVSGGSFVSGCCSLQRCSFLEDQVGGCVSGGGSVLWMVSDAGNVAVTLSGPLGANSRVKVKLGSGVG